jgi:hypothetical protein
MLHQLYAELEAHGCVTSHVVVVLLYGLGANVWIVVIKEDCTYRSKGFTE